MEAAHYAATWSPEIKCYYQRQQAKKHILVAKQAVANKLARACYHMLKNPEPFDVKRAFDKSLPWRTAEKGLASSS